MADIETKSQTQIDAEEAVWKLIQQKAKLLEQGGLNAAHMTAFANLVAAAKGDSPQFQVRQTSHPSA